MQEQSNSPSLELSFFSLFTYSPSPSCSPLPLAVICEHCHKTEVFSGILNCIYAMLRYRREGRQTANTGHISLKSIKCLQQLHLKGLIAFGVLLLLLFLQYYLKIDVCNKGKGGEVLGTTTRMVVKEEETIANAILLMLQPNVWSSGNSKGCFSSQPLHLLIRSHRIPLSTEHLFTVFIHIDLLGLLLDLTGTCL